MFLRHLSEQRHTLAFRLTLWYGAIFTISSLLAFLLFYLSAASYVYGRADTEIWEEIEELSELLTAEGMDAVRAEILEESESEDTEEMFLRLIRPDGSELISTALSTWEHLKVGTDVPNSLHLDRSPVFETLDIPGKPYEVRVAYAAIGTDIILHLGILLKNETEMMTVLKNIFMVTMILVFLLAALIGWFMARRALTGVEEVTQTAWQLSEGALDQRVPVKNRGQEIERMALMFNYMVDQIQKLIWEMQEMTDNIAHDLKSPITRIRGAAEVTLTTGRSVREYEQMTASTIEECDYLLEMINTMLDISETEAGAGIPDFQKTDMAALVRDVCDLFEPLIEKRELNLVLKTPDLLHLHGDIRKLQRLMGNLLDNAVKYTFAGGIITVSLFREDSGEIVLSVSDTGIGIAEADLAHIFERFYRCDQSRAKTGSGLGLCLVQAIVKLHRGDISVRSSPDKGTAFVVRLPRMKPVHS